MNRVIPLILAAITLVGACVRGSGSFLDQDDREPGLSPIGQELWAVDATSSNDVWAVGSSYAEGTGFPRSVILHWDGERWSRVPSPDVRMLTDVAAVSRNDAWAVGGERILHWDGRAWEISRHHAPLDSYFTSVDASGPDDAWIVGIQHGERVTDEYGSRYTAWATLALHWDGDRWEIVPSPNITTRDNRFEAVLIRSPTEVLAVGSAVDRLGDSRVLTLRWDGSTWRLVPSPNPGNHANGLGALGPDGPGGVWAVGGFADRGNRRGSLYLRWAGDGWESVPGPAGDALRQYPDAVSAASRGDGWAVGSEGTGSFLIAHWDGKKWSRLNSGISALAPISAMLSDVVAVTPTDAWAVGRYSYQNQVNTWGPPEVLGLIEHWDGSTWTLMDAPRPSE
jgi:hypothetical protein